MTDNDNKEEDFSLYTEKIVVKPTVKYRKLIRCGQFFLSACLFGVIASVVMVFLYPRIESKVSKQDKPSENLVINKDEYPQEEVTQEGLPEGEVAPSEEAQDEQNKQEGLSEPTSSTTGVGLSDYSFTLKSMVSDIQYSILAIDIYNTSVDDFLSENKSTTETVALVIGQINGEFILLTDYSMIANSETVIVKLSNSIELTAEVRGHDESSGIALLGIKLTDIPSNLRGLIKVAQLDNSYKVRQGDIAIAVGKLYGQVKSCDYCTVTRISSTAATDNAYSVLNTGMVFHSGDYAFLFNSNGNVIGITKNSDSGFVQAYGVSELKSMIEGLYNGSGIKYMGIRGQNVTGNLATMYGLPMGIYVTDVLVDSPAFNAGLQPGDVIIDFNGNLVLTIQSFSEKLYQCSSGETVDITVKRMGKDGYHELNLQAEVASR